MESLINMLGDLGVWGLIFIIVIYIILNSNIKIIIDNPKATKARKFFRDYVGNVDSDKKGGK